MRLGECIGIDDLIYYMFNENHRKETKAKHFKLGIGVDYGQQNATAYQAAGVNINTRRMEGLAEFYHSDRESRKQKSPSDYAKELINLTDMLQEKYSCSMFYVYISDPSAQGLAEEIKCLARQTRKTLTMMLLLVFSVFKCLTYGIETISESQENLIREMGTYEYDKKSIEAGKEKPIKIDDYCCDAWRYLTQGFWSKIKHFLR